MTRENDDLDRLLDQIELRAKDADFDLEAFLRERCPDDQELQARVRRLWPHLAGWASESDTTATLGGVLESGREHGLPGDLWRVLESADPTELVPPIPGYSVRRFIAEGGMGSVFEAMQLKPRRRVAIKFVRSDKLSPRYLVRFNHEAEILGRLEHHAIARVYATDVVNDGSSQTPYLVMEYVDGTQLREFAETHDLTTRERLRLLMRVCEGVQYAHQKGVIHRDLKPDNILVMGDGQPKILDFGVAKLVEPDLHAPSLTHGEGMPGTPLYMSPEQIRGSRDELDTRSDIYALGVISYELLTGQLPILLSGRSLAEQARAIQDEEPRRLSAVDPALRGDLDIIVHKALRKDPVHRYGAASEFAADLQRYLRNEPISARPPSATYHMRKFVRRYPWFSAALFVLAVVILGFLYHIDRKNSELQAALGDVVTWTEESALQVYRRGAWDDVVARLGRVSRPSPSSIGLLLRITPYDQRDDQWLALAVRQLAKQLGTEVETGLRVAVAEYLLFTEGNPGYKEVLEPISIMDNAPAADRAYANVLLGRSSGRGALRNALLADPFHAESRRMMMSILLADIGTDELGVFFERFQSLGHSREADAAWYQSHGALIAKNTSNKKPANSDLALLLDRVDLLWKTTPPLPLQLKARADILRLLGGNDLKKAELWTVAAEFRSRFNLLLPPELVRSFVATTFKIGSDDHGLEHDTPAVRGNIEFLDYLGAEPTIVSNPDTTMAFLDPWVNSPHNNTFVRAETRMVFAMTMVMKLYGGGAEPGESERKTLRIRIGEVLPYGHLVDKALIRGAIDVFTNTRIREYNAYRFLIEQKTLFAARKELREESSEWLAGSYQKEGAYIRAVSLCDELLTEYPDNAKLSEIRQTSMQAAQSVVAKWGKAKGGN